MTFREFLDSVLVPMFPGAQILDDLWEPQNQIASLVAVVPGGTRLRIRQDTQQASFYELSRPQPFDPTERDFVENLVIAFAKARAQAEAYIGQLQHAILRDAIAKTVAPGRYTQQRVIGKVIAKFSNWATQTYEGDRVSSGCLITTSHLPADASNVSVDRLLSEDFAKSLTDGVDSWWRMAAVGGVMRFETSEDETSLKAPVDAFFPHRYRPIALRTSGNAVAITLNRSGEILVFANQNLRFAMRRGLWVNFAHDSIIRQMSPGGAGAAALRTAIYASCLDASFARSGGCIGLLRTRDLSGFDSEEIVAPENRIDAMDNTKAEAAATLVGARPFHALSRSVRKELLGLDGAMVLLPSGSVYAAGAILKLGDVDFGTQGGRSAAAKTLSLYGLGIKISEDGMISGYKKEKGTEQAAFKVG
jgi:hypothetical protein